MSRILTIACVLLTATAAISPASAQHLRSNQITVSYADLDIAHPEGAEVLLGRLRMASQQVCGGSPEIREISSWRFYNRCVSETMDRAVASVHVALVAQLFGKPELVAEDSRPSIQSVARNN